MLLLPGHVPEGQAYEMRSRIETSGRGRRREMPKISLLLDCVRY